MDYHCFKCSATISVGENQQVGFKQSCSSCTNDLHVCRNCKFYDSNSYNQCHEPSAERVVDKEKANYCDYFKFNQGSSGAKTTAQQDAKKKLDGLFK